MRGHGAKRRELRRPQAQSCAECIERCIVAQQRAQVGREAQRVDRPGVQQRVPDKAGVVRRRILRRRDGRGMRVEQLGGRCVQARRPQAARQLLAGLLMRLSDRQITDLFDMSRIAERRREVTVLSSREPAPTALVGGAPTSEWVRVFTEKRDAIASARCA